METRLKHRLAVIFAVATVALASEVALIHEVFAQQTCSVNSDCAALGPEFRCISNRCNLPPPIWNISPGTISGGQSGAFDVSGNSQVRGNFTVGEGFTLPGNAPLGSFITAGNIYTNAIYSRLSGSPDSIWVGDTDDTLQIQGALTVGGNIALTGVGATVDGVDLDTVLTGLAAPASGGLTVAGTGHNRTISMLTGCAANQILKWNGSAWTCAADAGGGISGSGGTGEIAFWNAADTLTSSPRFTFDSTAGFLGYGLLTVLGDLQVHVPNLLNTNSASRLVSIGGAPFPADLIVYGNISSNRVGIGTAAPAVPLDVAGDVRWSGTLAAGTVPWARLGAFPAACPAGQYVSAVGGILTCSTPSGAGITSETDPVYTAWLADPVLSTLTVDTSTLVIDEVNNRVGIGTTTPGSALDVAGDAQIFSNLTVGSGFSIPAGAPIGSSITAGNVYTNAIYSRLLGSADNIWVGDQTDTVQVAGALRVQNGATITSNIVLTTIGATVDGVNLDNALTDLTVGTPGGVIVSGSGHSRAVSLLSTCAANQILKWNGSAWTCAADEAGVGGITSETDPVYTAWLADPQLSTLTVDTSTLVIDEVNNRVGIGTTTPGSALTVAGDAQVFSNLTVGGLFTIPASAPLGSFITEGNIYANAIYSRLTGSADDIWIGDTDDTLRVQGALNVDGNTLVVDRVNNRVGIGTATPSFTLQVVGNVAWSGNLVTGTVPWARVLSPTGCLAGQFVIGANTSGFICVRGNSGTASRIAFFDGNPLIPSTALISSDALYWDDVNDRLGIGTTAPQTRLHVVGTTRFGSTEVVSGNLSVGGREIVRNDGSLRVGPLFETDFSASTADGAILFGTLPSSGISCSQVCSQRNLTCVTTMEIRDGVAPEIAACDDIAAFTGYRLCMCD